MSVPIFFIFWFVTSLIILQGNPINADPAIDPKPSPHTKGFFINCGATEDVEIDQLKYVTDDSFISPENTKTAVIDEPDILPILSTVRYMPDRAARKKCYNFPVVEGVKYLVKTIYYYGHFDGGTSPPVFDLITDGTKWSTVNTTEDFSKGMASFYEAVFMASDERLSVCLAYNDNTASSPFISALQVQPLDNSVYNTIDFSKYALVTVARHNFAPDGDVISFPDDKYDRHWYPFLDKHPEVLSHSNVSASEFWNNPPQKVFQSAITASRGQSLQVMWPPFPLPKRPYYIALYFQDTRTPSPYSWRVFDIDINGETFYGGLNVTSSGVMLHGDLWPISGQTKITLTPRSDVPVGPLINAAEILQLVAIQEKTAFADANVMDDFLKSVQNLPPDWSGDPCMPLNISWTGVGCRQRLNTRIISLNLTNLHLSGTLPESLANLTALHHLWLGGNSFSGPLPDLSTLTALETLHLENNQFQGPIPISLGQLPNLREVFLQNNNFTGDIPASLLNGRDIFLQF
ncbi:OLC1v1002987C2 [Oldenlandia corymbosa var. corymbosa]|nr:OLC1v1002987C2 [Oldenlandia corymbosa var. corymbosa]